MRITLIISCLVAVLSGCVTTYSKRGEERLVYFNFETRSLHYQNINNALALNVQTVDEYNAPIASVAAEIDKVIAVTLDSPVLFNNGAHQLKKVNSLIDITERNFFNKLKKKPSKKPELTNFVIAQPLAVVKEIPPLVMITQPIQSNARSIPNTSDVIAHESSTQASEDFKKPKPENKSRKYFHNAISVIPVRDKWPLFTPGKGVNTLSNKLLNPIAAQTVTLDAIEPTPIRLIKTAPVKTPVRVKKVKIVQRSAPTVYVPSQVRETQRVSTKVYDPKSEAVSKIKVVPYQYKTVSAPPKAVQRVAPLAVAKQIPVELNPSVVNVIEEPVSDKALKAIEAKLINEIKQKNVQPTTAQVPTRPLTTEPAAEEEGRQQRIYVNWNPQIRPMTPTMQRVMGQQE